jgi:hypothetical protein
MDISTFSLLTSDGGERIAAMTPRPSTLPELHRTLQASLPFGPGYPGRSGFMLSNHLPMALHALHRLGAPQSKLERHLAQWLPRLLRVEPAGDAPPAGNALPAETHDRASAYLQALARLEREAQADDDATLLRRHLPALVEVPEASAFHGVIRVAHALQAGYRPELLRALAAWQAASRTRDEADPRSRPPGSGFDMRAALAAAHEDAGLRMTPRTGTSIVSDMVAARALPSFERHAAAFTPTLDDLAEGSLAAYLATRDFTALHLVTGVHATRVVLETAPLDDATRARALARVARAWLAAWVSIGAPAPDWTRVHEGAACEGDWSDAMPALLASSDDHVIKLADAAREEWRHRGWPGYARCLPR